MHGVFTALVNGFHDKGEGGVLWVKGDTCTYCFPEDFGNEKFADGLKMLLRDPHSQSIFLVVNQHDHSMEVVAYLRKRVYDEWREELRQNALRETAQSCAPVAVEGSVDDGEPAPREEGQSS